MLRALAKSISRNRVTSLSPAETALEKSSWKKRIFPLTTSRAPSSIVAMSRTTPSRTASRARRAWAACSSLIASQRAATFVEFAAVVLCEGAAASGGAPSGATRTNSTTRGSRGGGGGGRQPLGLASAGTGHRGSAAGASAFGDGVDRLDGGDPVGDPRGVDAADDSDPEGDAGAARDVTSKAMRTGRSSFGTSPMTYRADAPASSGGGT